MVERQVEFGRIDLVGQRITKLIIEDWEEATKLATQDGMRWFQCCVVPAFLSRSQQKQSDEENKSV